MWKDVGGTKIYFHYSDEGLIGEYDAGGVEIKTYGYKPGSTWTTDPLFMKAGSQFYFYHNDHLGTPQKLTATNGAIVWSARYESFGKATLEIEVVENNLRFPGQYYDQESGLHYNNHRYYDPKMGRYLTPDPIGLAGGINLLAYVDNNPINAIDPLGLQDNIPNIGFDPIGVFPRDIEIEIKEFLRARPRLFRNEIQEKAVETTECITCTVTCSVPVLIGEAVGQGAQYAAKKAANRYAKEWVAKAIPYVAWVSTAYSANQLINCLVECSLK